jgi:hypothetical protein
MPSFDIALYREAFETRRGNYALHETPLSLHVCRCIIWHALIAITLTKERERLCAPANGAALLFSLRSGVLIDSSAFGRNLVFRRWFCERLNVDADSRR